MRKIFIALALFSLIVLIWAGAAVIKHYYMGNKELLAGIDEMQKLQIFSKTGNAEYDEQATKHKPGDKYTFTVYGKPYNHQVVMANPPQSDRFDVQYLPDNPNIQSVDPTAQLLMYKQQLATKSAIPAINWILLLVGLFGLIYSGLKLRVKPVQA